MKTAILLTCYNRKDITLNCLRYIYKQDFISKFDIFICDDGSTDGTSLAIKENFPSVFIIYGNGNLYWNRGMLKAWNFAKSNDHYDYYIWINDDVILRENAFTTMLNVEKDYSNSAIVCGAFCDKNGHFTYGGKTKNFMPIIPNGKAQDVYYLNGNCVLIPNKIVDKIGMLDKMFVHHLGDYDYGLRALEAGGKIVSTPIYIGTCETNKIIGNRSRKYGVSLIKRLKILYSPLGYNPVIRYRYQKRHFGMKIALLNFIKIHINNIIPDYIYDRKKNGEKS